MANNGTKYMEITLYQPMAIRKDIMSNLAQGHHKTQATKITITVIFKHIALQLNKIPKTNKNRT